MSTSDKKKPEIQMQVECESVVHFPHQNNGNCTSQLRKEPFVALKFGKDLMREVCSVLTSAFFK